MFLPLNLLCFNTYHNIALKVDILGGRQPFADYRGKGKSCQEIVLVQYISDTWPPLFDFVSTALEIEKVSGIPVLDVALQYYISFPTVIALLSAQ
jgi:hypothetical protein